jgi:competence protein ComEC
MGCVVTMPDGRAVAYVVERRAFPEDCRRAAIIVSRLRAPPDCAAAIVLDRAHLDGHGATSLGFRDGVPRIVTVRSPEAARPWLPKPRPPARSAPQSVPRAAPAPELPDEEPDATPGEP